VIRAARTYATIGLMNTDVLSTFSGSLADAVAAAARSVVQVRGRRRPASGVVFAENAVLTTGRALGRDNGVQVRTADGRTLDAEPAGWDPATQLAVLRVAGLDTPAATPSAAPARVGHLALAVGRSWSNAVTATVGTVAVIGGPLQTGRGRSIDEIIRTSAPMHQGFAGGALADTSGQLLGVATAAEIRGLGVVIPSAIAWRAATDVLVHGQVKHGYLGVAIQDVSLGDRQRGADGPASALLVIGLTPGSPADDAGLLVGDLVTAVDGVPIDSADGLLGVLSGERVGRAVPVSLLRGGGRIDVSVTVGERPGR
jgi:S1-C subfamily serine protease